MWKNGEGNAIGFARTANMSTRTAILVMIGIVVMGSCEKTDPTCIYISPLGNDGNAGTKKNPLKSVQKAQEILLEYNPEADAIIKIASDKGCYADQYIESTYSNPTYSITFESEPREYNAVFVSEGDSIAKRFFAFRSERGLRSNIILKRLTIKNYISGAILFAGDRESRNRWNGYNLVEDCIFENIGNRSAPDKPLAYSVIGLTNSRNNTIRNCRFVNISNFTIGTFLQKYPDTIDPSELQNNFPNIAEYNCSRKLVTNGEKQRYMPIIAIYIAHFGDSNIVDGCYFSKIKGDVLRVRDSSNYIQFIDNYVEISGWNGIVTTWYCSPFTQQCTKKNREKPSKGLLIANNTIKGNWLYGYPTIYYDIQYQRSINDIDHLKMFEIDISNNVLSQYY